jgi:hypothetical protein
VRADVAQGDLHVDLAVAGQVELLACRRQVCAEQPEATQFLVEQLLAAVSLRARSSLWNQARTLSRERLLARKPLAATSQSRRGSPVLAVSISTRSPLCSLWSSGTMRPSTFAPRQRWPTSVCT